VPQERALENKRTGAIPQHIIPTVEAVTAMYINSGGQIQMDARFGKDPLANYPQKAIARDNQFIKYFKFSEIFHGVSNGNTGLFNNGLLYYIRLTEISI